MELVNPRDTGLLGCDKECVDRYKDCRETDSVYEEQGDRDALNFGMRELNRPVIEAMNVSILVK